MPMDRRHRHLKRYREIASALARHGLGWLALQLNLGRFIPFHWGLLGHPRRPEPYTQAEHIRLALEDLGTTFIKLGQILSTRPDLLPPAYIAQLSLLQDSAPSIPYTRVKEIVETELGRPLESTFKSFKIEPRASASIGQVHAARLMNGLPVVVKVQRPGVAALVEEDLEILRNLGRTASRRTDFGAHYDIEGWIEEFAFVMLNELDYIREGRNADRIRANFAGDDRIHVPEIHWDYSTGKVLTMEEIVGIKINDIKALDQAGLDRHRIAESTAHILLTMAYGHGFFHADPHPGNLFVLPGEVIGLIDYGMVGRLDEQLRYAIVRVAVALIRKDTDRLVDELAMLGIARTVIRREPLKRDLDHLIQRFYDKLLREIVAAQAFNELVSVALRYRLQLPSELIVLFKVIAMSEGIGSQLDPDFKLMEFAEPYFKRFWAKNYSVSRQAKRITDAIQDSIELGLILPTHLRRLLGQVERGELVLLNRIEGAEKIQRAFYRAANRVAESILIASLVIGLGLIMLIYHPPGWERVAGWFFAILFATVFFLGIGLLWSIWRTGR